MIKRKRNPCGYGLAQKVELGGACRLTRRERRRASEARRALVTGGARFEREVDAVIARRSLERVVVEVSAHARTHAGGADLAEASS